MTTKAFLIMYLVLADHQTNQTGAKTPEQIILKTVSCFL
jgi:hypothetical protein